MKSPSVRGSTLTETELFSTVGPGEEHKTNKPSPTRRVQERLEGETEEGIRRAWTPSQACLC